MNVFTKYYSGNTNVYSRASVMRLMVLEMGSNKSNMKLVTVHLPESLIEGLDELVRQRYYPSRSEAIRIAVRDLLKKDLWRMRISRKARMIA